MTGRYPAPDGSSRTLIRHFQTRSALRTSGGVCEPRRAALIGLDAINAMDSGRVVHWTQSPDAQAIAQMESQTGLRSLTLP